MSTAVRPGPGNWLMPTPIRLTPSRKAVTVASGNDSTRFGMAHAISANSR